MISDEDAPKRKFDRFNETNNFRVKRFLIRGHIEGLIAPAIIIFVGIHDFGLDQIVRSTGPDCPVTTEGSDMFLDLDRTVWSQLPHSPVATGGFGRPPISMISATLHVLPLIFAYNLELRRFIYQNHPFRRN